MARRQKQQATPTGVPVIAQEVDTDVDSYTVTADGRHMERTVFALSEEQVAQVKAGYVCIKCLEHYANAFPDECAVCKFPMRDQQSAEFAKDFRGDIRFGPTTSIEEELGIMQEMRERESAERMARLGLTIPKPSIILPRGL
jgi:hypothetical protein